MTNGVEAAYARPQAPSGVTLSAWPCDGAIFATSTHALFAWHAELFLQAPAGTPTTDTAVTLLFVTHR